MVPEIILDLDSSERRSCETKVGSFMDVGWISAVVLESGELPKPFESIEYISETERIRLSSTSDMESSSSRLFVNSGS